MDSESSILQTRGHFQNANGVYYHNALATSGGENRWKLGLDSDGTSFRFDRWSGGSFAAKGLVLATSSSTIFGNGLTSSQFDGSTTADETRFLLWDVTSGTLKRVSRGAADSAGTGFRTLRIPN